MLGLAKRVGARILLASTSEVYGDPEQHPQTEEYKGSVNPIGIRACYDEGKELQRLFLIIKEAMMSILELCGFLIPMVLECFPMMWSQ